MADDATKILLRQLLETQLAENLSESKARVRLVTEEERLKTEVGQRPALMLLAAPLEEMNLAVYEDGFQAVVRQADTAFSYFANEPRATSHGLATAERWGWHEDTPPAEWRIDYHHDGLIAGYVGLPLREQRGYFPAHLMIYLGAFAKLIEVTRRYPGDQVGPFLVRVGLVIVGTLELAQHNQHFRRPPSKLGRETWLPEVVFGSDEKIEYLRDELIKGIYRAFGVRNVHEGLLDPGE